MNTNRQKFAEHRKHARFPVLEYALIEFQNNPIAVRSLIVDVSLGGVQVRSRSECKAGDKAILIIGSVEDASLKVPVVVKYCRLVDSDSLYAIGFKFAPRTKIQKVHITNYVHNLFITQGALLLEDTDSDE